MELYLLQHQPCILINVASFKSPVNGNFPSITVQPDMHYFKDMYCGMQPSNVSVGFTGCVQLWATSTLPIFITEAKYRPKRVLVFQVPPFPLPTQSSWVWSILFPSQTSCGPGESHRGPRLLFLTPCSHICLCHAGSGKRKPPQPGLLCCWQQWLIQDFSAAMS